MLSSTANIAFDCKRNAGWWRSGCGIRLAASGSRSQIFWRSLCQFLQLLVRCLINRSRATRPKRWLRRRRKPQAPQPRAHNRQRPRKSSLKRRSKRTQCTAIIIMAVAATPIRPAVRKVPPLRPRRRTSSTKRPSHTMTLPLRR